MKKYLLLLAILLAACSSSRRYAAGGSTHHGTTYVVLSKFKGDTLRYVQYNFIDNKQKYTGKPLKQLLDDLEIPVRSYLPSPAEDNPAVIPYTSLLFYSQKQFARLMNKPGGVVNLIIKWSPPLPGETVSRLWNSSKGVWTEADRHYFDQQTVGDVLTSKWGR